MLPIATVARVAVAILFLVVAAIFVQERLFTTVSIEGVVTAPLIVMRAPIDGVVRKTFVRTGSPASAEAPMFIIDDPMIDDRSLVELTSRLDNLKQQIGVNSTKAAELSKLRRSLEERKATYRQSAERRLDSMVSEAAAQAASAKAAAQRSEVELRRVSSLSDHGNASVSRLDDITLNNRQAKLEVTRLEAILERRAIELEAAKSGIIIGEGYADTPYSQQRIDDVSVKLIDVESEGNALQSVIRETESRIAAEHQRLSRLQAYVVNSPSDGLIWNTHVAEGATVVRNTPLADIADCGHSFVEATISESNYDTIRVGDAAKVTLRGNPTALDGVVRSRRGSGVNAMLLGSAAKVASSPEAMTVVIEIPRREIEGATDGACQVGRTATVVFDPASRSSRYDSLLEKLKSFGERTGAYIRTAFATED